jgi:hypothetical protein
MLQEQEPLQLRVKPCIVELGGACEMLCSEVPEYEDLVCAC